MASAAIAMTTAAASIVQIGWFGKKHFMIVPKRSPDWFLGAVGDEQERRIDVPLPFLEPGRRYRAEVYRDGDDADYRTNPRSIINEQRTVTTGDRLAIRIAPGGGAAVRFVTLSK
jgi:alpha-glucosidase